MPTPAPLLRCVLRDRVLVEAAVLPHHAQGGTAVTGHAGEALAARETENSNLVKAHTTLLPLDQPRLLHNGPDCEREREREKSKDEHVFFFCILMYSQE